MPLIHDRLIDFIRVHHLRHRRAESGTETGRLLRILRRAHGLAWPGRRLAGRPRREPAARSACHNFGIQEAHLFPERTQAVFPGCPEIRDGAMWSNEQPGLGIDIDEALAAKYPVPGASAERRLAAGAASGRNGDYTVGGGRMRRGVPSPGLRPPSPSQGRGSGLRVWWTNERFVSSSYLPWSS